MKSLPPFLLFPLFILLFFFQLLWLREDIIPVEAPPATEKEDAKSAPKTVCPQTLKAPPGAAAAEKLEPK